MAEKTEEETIEELQTDVIAGLSILKPLSIGDIKWAVERGFEAGQKFNSDNRNRGS